MLEDDGVVAVICDIVPMPCSYVAIVCYYSNLVAVTYIFNGQLSLVCFI